MAYQLLILLFTTVLVRELGYHVHKLFEPPCDSVCVGEVYNQDLGEVVDSPIHIEQLPTLPPLLVLAVRNESVYRGVDLVGGLLEVFLLLFGKEIVTHEGHLIFEDVGREIVRVAIFKG